MRRVDAALLLALCASWANSCGSSGCDCAPLDEPFERGTFVVTSEPPPGTTDTAVRTSEGRSQRDLVLVDSLLEVTPQRVVLDTQAVDGSEVHIEWTVTSRTPH